MFEIVTNTWTVVEGRRPMFNREAFPIPVSKAAAAFAHKRNGNAVEILYVSSEGAQSFLWTGGVSVPTTLAEIANEIKRGRACANLSFRDGEWLE